MSEAEKYIVEKLRKAEERIKELEDLEIRTYNLPSPKWGEDIEQLSKSYFMENKQLARAIIYSTAYSDVEIIPVTENTIDAAIQILKEKKVKR